MSLFWKLWKEYCNRYWVEEIIKLIDVKDNENKFVFDFEIESDEWFVL